MFCINMRTTKAQISYMRSCTFDVCYTTSVAAQADFMTHNGENSELYKCKEWPVINQNQKSLKT